MKNMHRPVNKRIDGLFNGQQNISYARLLKNLKRRKIKRKWTEVENIKSKGENKGKLGA